MRSQCARAFKWRWSWRWLPTRFRSCCYLCLWRARSLRRRHSGLRRHGGHAAFTGLALGVPAVLSGQAGSRSRFGLAVDAVRGERLSEIEADIGNPIGRKPAMTDHLGDRILVFGSFGAGRGGRTPTDRSPADFESHFSDFAACCMASHQTA